MADQAQPGWTNLGELLRQHAAGGELPLMAGGADPEPDNAADELAGLPPEVLGALSELGPEPAPEPEAKAEGEPAKAEPKAKDTASGTKAEPKPAPEPKPATKAATARADKEPKEPAKADPKATAAKAGTDAKADGDKTGEGEAQAPEPSTADWREALKTANKDELRKDPTVAAIVGDLVDRARKDLTAEITRQIKADMAADAEQARLDALAESDPGHPLAQEHLTAKQRREQASQVETIRNEALSTATAAVRAFKASLSEGQQAALEPYMAKRYEGEWAQGFTAYLADIVPALVEHGVTERLEAEVEAARKELEAQADEEVEARVRERLGETNGDEPSPKVTASDQRSGGKYADLTKRDIETMDWREFEANENEIMTALARRAAA